MDGLEAAHVRRNGVGQLAVDPVAGADGNLRALVHHVHLRNHQPLRPVDHVGVAQQRQVEPSAAPWPACHRAVLLSARAQQRGRVVLDFGRKRSLADARHVGLGHADDGADRGRPDAGSRNRSARRRRR